MNDTELEESARHAAREFDASGRQANDYRVFASRLEVIARLYKGSNKLRKLWESQVVNYRHIANALENMDRQDYRNAVSGR